MTEQQQVNRNPWPVVAGISALVLAVGGGTAWWTWNSQRSIESTPGISIPVETPQVSPSPSVSASPSAPTGIEQTVQIYLFKDDGGEPQGLPVPVQVAATEPTQLISAAFDKLLTVTATDPNAPTAIPQGTQLRGMKVDSDGIHVDLSAEFTTGGGSQMMIGRLQQVLYTATALEPDAKVWISVEGKPLTLLGGEGLEVPQPLTRQVFKSEFMF
ncbi:MAG TPA: GerMN domain-containing protein [Oscillatoriaceae cyanobacterium M33_DOE_052]|uniref:Spore germination protein n=1 Tax=Planktothricoides sp. SpSt-374 TaxID=2282167 RepID=A0A7C3VFY5_9CYAN|nr:GerMN domain-containing protein [Oscillatoriaceae cyanobacterium M33_DOE_052]